MRAKLLIIALVATTAGATGAIGGSILTGASEPEASAQDQSAQVSQTRSRNRSGSSDDCAKVARRVSRRNLSDSALRKALRRARGCEAIVIDSQAPATVLAATGQNQSQSVDDGDAFRRDDDDVVAELADDDDDDDTGNSGHGGDSGDVDPFDDGHTDFDDGGTQTGHGS